MFLPASADALMPDVQAGSASQCRAGLDAINLALLDRWQHDFPIAPRPFFQIGELLDMGEEEVVARYRLLHSDGLISRIGAIVAPNTVGASTLAAVSADPHEVNAIAALINEEQGVNHNYEREHAINLWFVITAASETELEAALARLSQRLQRPVRDLRLERPFHLDLGFSIGTATNGSEAKRRLQPADTTKLMPQDRRLLSGLENGLPLISRPFCEIGRRAGMTETGALARLNRLSEAGIIRRFGVVLHHRKLGFAANAMVVFDIAERDVDGVGERLSRMSGVTLCYRRRRALDWRYNLYCMVHARSRTEAEPAIDTLRDATDAFRRDMAVLFSTRCFRQRGARFRKAADAEKEQCCERASL